MTKSSTARLRRRHTMKKNQRAAAKLTPAEARQKLAEWAASGGDLQAIKNQRPPRVPPPAERRMELPPTRPNRNPKLFIAPRGAQDLKIGDVGGVGDTWSGS